MWCLAAGVIAAQSDMLAQYWPASLPQSVYDMGPADLISIIAGGLLLEQSFEKLSVSDVRDSSALFRMALGAVATGAALRVGKYIEGYLEKEML